MANCSQIINNDHNKGSKVSTNPNKLFFYYYHYFILFTYKPNEEERMHKVLSKSSLDFGQRPSAAYRQMASWTGDLLDKRIVLFLWSKLLLENIAPTVYQNINYKD